MKMKEVTSKTIRTEFIIGGLTLLISTIALYFIPSIGVAISITIGWLAFFTNCIIGFIILSNQRIIEEMRKEDG